jgi:hypothetical protein
MDRSSVAAFSCVGALVVLAPLTTAGCERIRMALNLPGRRAMERQGRAVSR